MNAAAPVLERKFSGLVAKINSGGCVLVLGPRITVPQEVVQGSSNVPIDEYIATRLLQELSDTAGLVGLRAAVSRYERDKGPSACRSAIQEVISELDGLTTGLHRNLASLPFKLVLCATPDRMMVEAFKQAGKHPEWVGYSYCTDVYTPPAAVLPTADKPIVYSLFGRHDQPESMVLNDKNLLDYLVTVTRERPPLPDAVRATLRASSTVFLFIGFGFTNWWLRLLLKVLEITGVENRGVSLALEDRGSFNEAVYRENSGFFESLGIYIQPRDDWGLFAQELAEKYQAQRPQSAPAPAERGSAGVVRNGGPLVFLSYASDDADKVDYLGARLASRGVSVWLDRQGLRSGQNWENQIARVIAGVDAFIFIQTENTDRRDQDRGGVYNWEITEALRQAKNRPFGRVFFHHVTIGACRAHPNPELERLHRLAVDTDQAIEKLANDILQAHAETRSPAGIASSGAG